MGATGRCAEGDGREREHLIGVLQRTPTEHVTVEVRRPLEVTHVEHEMPKLTDLHVGLLPPRHGRPVDVAPVMTTTDQKRGTEEAAAPNGLRVFPPAVGASPPGTRRSLPSLSTASTATYLPIGEGEGTPHGAR